MSLEVESLEEGWMSLMPDDRREVDSMSLVVDLLQKRSLVVVREGPIGLLSTCQSMMDGLVMAGVRLAQEPHIESGK